MQWRSTTQLRPVATEVYAALGRMLLLGLLQLELYLIIDNKMLLSLKVARLPGPPQAVQPVANVLRPIACQPAFLESVGGNFHSPGLTHITIVQRTDCIRRYYHVWLFIEPHFPGVARRVQDPKMTGWISSLVDFLSSS